MNKKAKKEQSNTASGPERSKLSNSKMSRLDEQKSKERNGNGEEASEEEEMGVPWSLYAAHTLSTWGDNMWWFAGGCYMLELLPSSLRLTAIYGLVIAASVIVFGASVGRLVDTMGRISAARLSLAIQNLATAACALALAAFLHNRAELEPDGPDHPTLIVSVFAITLAAVARLASCGTNIIIQKDWIVVIAGGDNDKLATMNSILRTIELTTYAIAPAVAGCLFTLLGFGLTGLVIAAWNVVSVCLEYCLLSRIYRRHPGLADKQVGSAEDEEAEEGGGALHGWVTYFNHPVKLAGLGLACLYMTVLGFDNITYGYCLLQGVPHAALGVLVGVSAVVGVAGSLAYPPIRKRVGLERTGLLGMFLLVSCSSLALLSIVLPGSPMDLNVLVQSNINSSIPLSPTTIIPENTNPSVSETLAESEVFPDSDISSWLLANCSVIVFLTGIILARFGLWIVDLTVNQLLQEKVEEEGGVVNGVQESLNNSLDLAKCILVILLPAEETFGLLIIASFSCIPHQHHQQPDKEVVEEKEKMLEKGEEERAVVVKKTEKRKKGEVCSV